MAATKAGHRKMGQARRKDIANIVSSRLAIEQIVLASVAALHMTAAVCVLSCREVSRQPAKRLTHNHVITGTGPPRRVPKRQGKGVDTDRRRHDELAWPES
jgi:hypothetical protein